jgi:hypothetical protein
MAELIIIRAGQNSGKTTTTGLVYQELLKQATQEHIFNYQTVKKDSLKFNKDGETIDFSAILTINNRKIGIVSEGDIAKDTKVSITILIEMNVDVIICCARSVNRKGSTYRMLLEDFSKTNNIALEIYTVYCKDKSLKIEIKKTVVNTIVLKTMELLMDK